MISADLNRPRQISFKMFRGSHESRALLAAMKNQLSLTLKKRELSHLVRNKTTPSYSSIVSCSNCEGFMVQPVYMPCGHSVCKGCTEKSTMLNKENLICPKCNHSCPQIPAGFNATSSKQMSGEGEEGFGHGESSAGQHRMPTLTIQNAFRKWYPKWAESCRCREEGNKHANQGDYTSAIHWYTKALNAGVCDHRVLGNRSRSYLAMGEVGEALKDAQLACYLYPIWAKGHYRRAAVLAKQGQWREAIASYLLCLHLGVKCYRSVVDAACQLLDKNLSCVEKQVLSSTTSTKGGAHGAPPLSAHPSSSPSAQNSEELSFGWIVQFAVSDIIKCVEMEGSLRASMNADIAPAPADQVDISDFECVLCTSLLYSPVTTPCGHSFCQSCLCRSFDHSSSCPICRSDLTEIVQQHCMNLGKMNVDRTLDGILFHYFREACLKKKAQLTVETKNKFRVGISETESLPIFVCTVAYPTLQCPLHIFEPRYRLMIRRCMETSSKRFGMCQPSATTPAERERGVSVSFSDYGTVLHIDSMESSTDGRIHISTSGERRFKVLWRGMSDGYHTANVAFLFDERVVGKDEIASLRALQQDTYDHARKWLNSVPLHSKIMMMQLVTTPFPDLDPVPECCPNGPQWVWWLVHALPTTPTKKLDFLKCISLRDRLLMLKELLPFK